MPKHDVDMETLIQYFSDLYDNEKSPYYNITCVVQGHSHMTERDNFHLIQMLADEPFDGEAGLWVLDDLKERNFNLVIMKGTEERLFEDSKLMDYLGVPRLIL